VFTGQPFTLTPSLAARTAGSGAPVAIAGATFRVQATNCGACSSAAAGCLDAATQVITCRPDAAGAVSVEVAAFPPGATQPAIVSAYTATGEGVRSGPVLRLPVLATIQVICVSMPSHAVTLPGRSIWRHPFRGISAD
jgi:hypothetical protein